MTGKMELEYEGEQIGAHRIAKDLIKRACGVIFEGFFLGIDFAADRAVVRGGKQAACYRTPRRPTNA